MKSNIMTISEGKKGFSRLIQNAVEKNEDTVITKRGKPVAVIVPYSEFQHSKKMEAYKKILESRKAFLKAGVSAEKIFRLSKNDLEKRP